MSPTNSGERPDLARLKIAPQSSLNTPKALRWNSAAKIGVSGVLLIGLTLVGRSCLSDDKSGSVPSPVNIPASAPALPSQKVVASTGSVLNASGYVVAQRKAAVSSKATGRLKELRVVEGDVVKMGDILGVVENEDLNAVINGAQAELVAATAAIQSAEAELREATSDRKRKLALGSSNAVSGSEVDSAENRFRRANANLASANANVEVAKAKLEKAKIDFDFTLIRAPFDGTVLTKSADVGEVVAPFGSSADARAALVTLADMHSLEIEADVSESNISKVRLNQLVTITLDSYPEKTYRGYVDKIVPTVDRAKATVMVKIRFEALDERVLPEMSAKVAFDLTETSRTSTEH